MATANQKPKKPAPKKAAKKPAPKKAAKKPVAKQAAAKPPAAKQAAAKHAAKQAAVRPAAKQAAAKKPAPEKPEPTAKKLAPKPVAPAKPPPIDDDLLRGVALVDAVMQKRRDDGDELVGTDAGTLDAMQLGDRPLTPALRRWLAADGEMFTLGAAQPLRQLVEAELGEWAMAFEPLYRLLTAPCVLFEGWGSDSRRLLYLGTPDEHGEYPVITIDIDDTPFACINGPVDVWLAQQAGFLADESVYGEVPPLYEGARQQHAKLSFGGNIAFVDDQFSKKLDPYGE